MENILPQSDSMYRRMIFNYLTDNKDDHCKNFSYYVQRDQNGKWRWHLAPAYDLTRLSEGYNGQHATSVNNTGFPRLDDFLAVGTKIRITKQRCMNIIEQVRDNCENLLLYDMMRGRYFIDY